MNSAERELLIWCAARRLRPKPLTAFDADEIDERIADVRQANGQYQRARTVAEIQTGRNSLSQSARELLIWCAVLHLRTKPLAPDEIDVINALVVEVRHEAVAPG